MASSVENVVLLMRLQLVSPSNLCLCGKENTKICTTHRECKVSNSNIAPTIFEKYRNAPDKDYLFSPRLPSCTMCSYQEFFTMTKKTSPSSSIQALYDLCRKTFTPSRQPSPSSQPIQKLCSLFDTIGPADVGLKEENQEDDRGHGLLGLNIFSRMNRWAQPITYVDIHEGDSFTMCIFCFPTSSVIPLHDHPGMTVLSKVLYGSLHVKAYDWVEPPCIRKYNQPGQPSVRLAKLVVDKVLTAPCSPSILYPKTGGNLHCFTAIAPCAVIDILAPPYDESAGRKCTYYHDYTYSSFGNDDDVGINESEEYAWLAETDTPEDLYMRPGMYTGPDIKI